MIRWIALALAAAAPLPAARPPADVPPPAFLLGQHLVDVGGGRRMNILCTGKGQPTVVFEQGTGSRIRDWEKVAPAIFPMTRTCLYDRAGYGFSDPPDHDMSLIRVTDDLHTLLRRAGVPGPLVLVGHSLGGLYATVYANRYPRDVLGLVLVDPAFADQMNYTRSDEDVTQFDKLRAAQITMLDQCLALAQAGKLTLAAPQGCFPARPANTPAELGYMEAYLNPGYYVATRREFEAAIPRGRGTALNSAQAHAVAKSFGVIPVRVLTAGSFAPFPGLNEAANQSYSNHWRAGHVALARRSTTGTHQVVPDSGHFIQYYQPKPVIDAITEEIRIARGKPG